MKKLTLAAILALTFGLAGAIVLSRARRSTEPLRILERQLIRLLTG